MPVTHSVLNIKNLSLTIDGEEVADAITNANLSITSTDVRWIPVSGNIQNEVGAPEYTLNLDFGQDLSSEDTLTMTLLRRHGETANVVLTPDNAKDATITANVTLKAPSQLGGAVGVATATATLPVNGTPVIVTAGA